MDPQLLDTLRGMREDITDHHLEVCQRLTALETTLSPTKDLEKRVRRLEGWRSKVVGGVVVLNLLAGSALAYVKTHLGK